jgi:hypothetical protein
MTNLLPAKVPQYLVRLQTAYSNKRDPLGEILAHSRYLCVEDTHYDNWNGGQWFHDVVLFLPLDQLGKIDIDDMEEVSEGIRDKLNKCATGFENEFFNKVRLELEDEGDADFKRSIPFSRNPPINPDTLDFWKPGLARVFISHRDAHKAHARSLSEALENYGMACFVAHDTIQPRKLWRSEILKGLRTMEIMVLFLTDDFMDSLYCNQEVGYALGRGIPILSLKLGQKDPPGFVSEEQAARGSITKPIEAAKKLFPLIGEALNREGRIQEVLVSNFAASPSWTDAKSRFDLMNAQVAKLNKVQADQIATAFKSNSQLHGSIFLTNSSNRLRKFMEERTGEEWVLDQRTLTRVDPLDDVPF